MRMLCLPWHFPVKILILIYLTPGTSIYQRFSGQILRHWWCNFRAQMRFRFKKMTWAFIFEVMRPGVSFILGAMRRFEMLFGGDERKLVWGGLYDFLLFRNNIHDYNENGRTVCAFIFCRICKNYSFSRVVFLFFYQTKIPNSFYWKINDSSRLRTTRFSSSRFVVRVTVVPNILTIYP